MNLLSASHSLNFASSEAARIAQADRVAQEIVANQLRQTAAAPLAPGSTVTARYQYRVGEDGVLYAVKSTIITETRPQSIVPQNVPGRTERQERNSEEFLSRQGRRNAPRISDFVPVRALLSPSDELALFSIRNNNNQAPQEALQQSQRIAANLTSAAQVSDENGQAVEAEVITLRTRVEDVRRQRAQYSVAGLYARNNDIVYNETPISRLAA